ncbi:class I tRNA ligase family protein [Actinomadura xylanilytica]|uniref:class I tRNA ligase family protein n=1 Tax=Actinomadura xylanilytica TaxID=887459 RepID=UPI00255B18E3|nr:class I tRNA ligase family protein [Actinomadura xylanilytica]MDL4774178.1 class I tRNA ligase family protein [Actinomadura xylanilytica]
MSGAPHDGGRPAIVVAATPTSNGDLHVGHMAGPYLAGDVYSRYVAATGRPVIYTTVTDDSQTYVPTTAHRQGVAPERLVAESTTRVQRTLTAMGLSMEGLPPIDGRYRETVLEFFTALHAAGRLRRRTVRLPYAERSGTYLYDGLMQGSCPSCLTGSAGGVCESCGHPNNYDELVGPRATMDPDEPVSYRDVEILTLPAEEYRDRLTAYYAEREGHWRPRAMRLVRELLAGPLPDIPITVPGTWGIAVPFPETPGQVLYPWVEAMPAVIYGTWWSAARRGAATAAVDEHWRAEHGAELVYFHGFDNVYHWGLLDLVMLMAHGDRYITPESNVVNEFYDLHGEKFSTSRGHLIWVADLLAEVPRDLVRFYLSLTAPEFQRTDFGVAALRAVTGRRLVEPWNRLADALHDAQAGVRPGPVPVSAPARSRAATMAGRFRVCYELRSFSAAQAAETVLAHLGRLVAAADSGAVPPGDLLVEARTLLAHAAPILIDAAAEATAAGVDLGLTAEPPAEIVPFTLPRLPEIAVPDGDPAGAAGRTPVGV